MEQQRKHHIEELNPYQEARYNSARIGNASDEEILREVDAVADVMGITSDYERLWSKLCEFLRKYHGKRGVKEISVAFETIAAGKFRFDVLHLNAMSAGYLGQGMSAYFNWLQKNPELISVKVIEPEKKDSEEELREKVYNHKRYLMQEVIKQYLGTKDSKPNKLFASVFDRIDGVLIDMIRELLQELGYSQVSQYGILRIYIRERDEEIRNKAGYWTWKVGKKFEFSEYKKSDFLRRGVKQMNSNTVHRRVLSRTNRVALSRFYDSCRKVGFNLEEDIVKRFHEKIKP